MEKIDILIFIYFIVLGLGIYFMGTSGPEHRPQSTISSSNERCTVMGFCYKK